METLKNYFTNANISSEIVEKKLETHFDPTSSIPFLNKLRNALENDVLFLQIMMDIPEVIRNAEIEYEGMHPELNPEDTSEWSEAIISKIFHEMCLAGIKEEDIGLIELVKHKHPVLSQINNWETKAKEVAYKVIKYQLDCPPEDNVVDNHIKMNGINLGVYFVENIVNNDALVIPMKIAMSWAIQIMEGRQAEIV